MSDAAASASSKEAAEIALIRAQIATGPRGWLRFRM
jgi:hypothetical protein